jgi:hypothetical protein
MTSSAVLDESFRLYRLTAWRNLPLSALLVLAAQAPNIYRLSHAQRDGFWWLLLVLGAAASLLLWAVIVLRMAAVSQGGQLRLRAALVPGFAALPRLLVLAAVSVPGIALGLVLLVLPGLFAVLVAVLAPLALLFERRAPLAAIREGLTLLRGHVGVSVIVLAMALAVFLVFYIVFAVLGVMITQRIAGEAFAAHDGVSYAGWIAQALFAPLLIAATLALYEALRRVKRPLPDAPPGIPAAAGRSADPDPPR